MLQLHTKDWGSILGPAKAEIGRLSWELDNWLAALRERGEDSGRVRRITCNSAPVHLRVTVVGETMHLGKGVLLWIARSIWATEEQGCKQGVSIAKSNTGNWNRFGYFWLLNWEKMGKNLKIFK